MTTNTAEITRLASTAPREPRVMRAPGHEWIAFDIAVVRAVGRGATAGEIIAALAAAGRIATPELGVVDATEIARRLGGPNPLATLRDGHWRLTRAGKSYAK